AVIGLFYIALNGVIRPISTALFGLVLSVIIGGLGTFAGSLIDSGEGLNIVLGILLTLALFGGFVGIAFQARQLSLSIQLLEARFQAELFEKNVLFGKVVHFLLYLISLPLSYCFAAYLLIALVSHLLTKTSGEILRNLCYLNFDLVTYDQTAFIWYGVVAVCGPIVSVFWRYHTHPLAKRLTLAGDLRT
ncbi:MAG: hypothetical protein R3261_06175, partial [Alphaproteobacteria bacterium]|nr:hypothetical protein [Alphaproteobacteria bacterium]